MEGIRKGKELIIVTKGFKIGTIKEILSDLLVDSYAYVFGAISMYIALNFF